MLQILRRQPPKTGRAALQTTLAEFRAALIDEIAEQQSIRDRCFKGAERFRYWAVFFGVASAVAVALFGGEPWAKYLSALAALSALCLTIERVFGVRARSGWHCEYRIALTDLLLDVDASVALEELRKRRVQLDGQMGGKFPQGSEPSLPARWAPAMERVTRISG